MKTSYKLRCLGTNIIIEDKDLPLESGRSPKPAFLRTEYAQKQLQVGTDADGLFKFASWLPVNREIEGSSAPATYRSTRLAEKLSLKNLYITFSGYWPDKGVSMVTGTFKECEAYSVCSRLPDDFNGTLVVASAGNTARAFIHVCSKNNIPLVVVVPEPYLGSIWADHDVNQCVKLIASGGNADYLDAINLSKTICEIDGYIPEGGAKNVARRDGMACTVLSAATSIGKIPEYYFQAVGSGTGAIAAWESNLRLLEDGNYGINKMKLMVAQNAPFLPIYDSWKAGSRQIIDIGESKARELIAETYAAVLTNRHPPYEIIGGLYDALTDTEGDCYFATNKEAEAAGAMFNELEGVDLAPSAAVALATIEKAAAAGAVASEALIMLNVTGGGYELLRKEKDIRQVPVSAVIPPERSDKDNIAKALEVL